MQDVSYRRVLCCRPNSPINEMIIRYALDGSGTRTSQCPTVSNTMFSFRETWNTLAEYAGSPFTMTKSKSPLNRSGGVEISLMNPKVCGLPP